jgi:hypothetical protein
MEKVYFMALGGWTPLISGNANSQEVVATLVIVCPGCTFYGISSNFERVFRQESKTA